VRQGLRDALSGQTPRYTPRSHGEGEGDWAPRLVVASSPPWDKSTHAARAAFSLQTPTSSAIVSWPGNSSARAACTMHSRFGTGLIAEPARNLHLLCRTPNKAALQWSVFCVHVALSKTAPESRTQSQATPLPVASFQGWWWLCQSRLSGAQTMSGLAARGYPVRQHQPHEP
jgi:hypothetical protein